MGREPTVEEGGGGGSARGSWDLEVSLGPAPPTLQEVGQSFLFVVQQHLVFLFEVAVNTRNDKMGRLGNGVPV